MHTMPVAFRLLQLNRSRFTIRPKSGFIAPLTAINLEIVYLPPSPPAPLIPDTAPQSDDTFYLESVVCVGATSNSFDAVPADWFNAKKRQVFTDSSLRIFYVGSVVLARLIEVGDAGKLRDVLERSDPEWHAADSTDAHGRTLLYLAIACGRIDIVQILLEFGADFRAPIQGRSPLEDAVASGQIIIAELLLARGASIERSQKTAYGPLHLAATGGFPELMRLLLLNGADVNSVTMNGRTALHLAAEEERRDCAEILMEAGARVDAYDSNGDTPLHVAASLANEEIARLLIAGGCAGIREARNRAGKKAYDVSEAERQRRFFDRMKAVESLMIAARRGDAMELARAIEVGAAVDGRNGSGWTALMIAGFKGRVESIRVLLNRGAEIDARDEDGYTALHCAVESGQMDAVELLVKRGADLNLRTLKGKTAMEIAVALGYVGIARLLVQEGAEEIRNQAVLMAEWPSEMEKCYTKENRSVASRDGQLRARFVIRTAPMVEASY